LVTDFSNCFNDADWLIVTPIYTANETLNNPDALRQELLINIQRHSTATVQYESDIDALADKLAPALQPGDVVITMGAGTISMVAHALSDALTRDACVVQNV
jgi:UDP-N-acetylmuramate--alanine ligase